MVHPIRSPAVASDLDPLEQHLVTALALYEQMGMARWIPSTRDIIERLGGDADPHGHRGAARGAP